MYSFSQFIGNIDSTFLLSLVIVVCALFFEDFTTVVIGLLASDGIIPTPLALVSIYLGIALGDTILYALGALARTHPRLAQYIEHDFTAPFRFWLTTRYYSTIFLGHFIPGLRMAAYLASGFFQRPFPPFLPLSLSGGFLVTTTLFSLSFWFGSVTTSWVSHARWGIALLFLLAIFLIGRHNVRLYRAKKEELSNHE